MSFERDSSLSRGRERNIVIFHISFHDDSINRKAFILWKCIFDFLINFIFVSKFPVLRLLQH